MSFWKAPFRLSTGVGSGILLFASSLMFAEELPVAGLPGPTLSLSEAIPIRFAPGSGSPAAAFRPFLSQEGMNFTAAFDPTARADRRPEGFSLRLMSRMNREALRFRRDQVSGSLDMFRRGPEDDLDTSAAASRSHEASRVVTRSIHRVLNDELDHLARTSLGLGPTLNFLQNLSLRRLRSGGAGRAAQASGGEGPAGASTVRRDGLRGDVGLRLDAHPALFFRARYRTVQGRLDLPMRNEPLRLSVEAPLTGRGRLALSSGFPRDGQPAWGTLTWNFSF
jgi:hypothetical protein